jgi:hypothetical protein
MLVTLLDNTTIDWKPHLQRHNLAEEKSSYHIKARNLLKELYPTCIILEEVSIPLTRKDIVYLDIFLPLLKIAVEVHGEQHYKFVAGFHRTYRDFLQQKQRDKKKAEWLELNGFKFVELKFNEDISEWKNKITT